MRAYCDIFDNRHARAHLDVLKSPGYSPSYNLGWCKTIDALATKKNLASARSKNTRRKIEQRALACPVQPDQTQDLATFENEGNLLHREETTKRFCDSVDCEHLVITYQLGSFFQGAGRGGHAH